jgi:CBS-domain-containing membrane protein
MSFFLSTNGQIHPYQFAYLAGEFEKARLEKTQVHSAIKLNNQMPLSDSQKDFYAIDIMSRDIFTASSQTKIEFIRYEMKQRNIRHIPVIDNGIIKGVISDRDLLKVNQAGTFFFMKAKHIMSNVLVLASEETPLAHIARVFLEEKISAIPIIDRNQKLTGIITNSDILKAIVYNRLIMK